MRLIVVCCGWFGKDKIRFPDWAMGRRVLCMSVGRGVIWLASPLGGCEVSVLVQDHEAAPLIRNK